MGIESEEKKQFHGQNTPKSERKGRLDEATLGYYRRVSEAVKKGFDNDSEKDLFMSNVFKQLNEEGLKVSQNQTASHIVEDLLKLASCKQLTVFLLALSEDWELACTDRFARYVMQTAISMAGQYLHDGSSATDFKLEDEDGDADESEVKKRKNVSLEALLKQLFSTFANNLALYMQDMYASHILQTIFEVLAGVNVSDAVARGKGNKHKTEVGKKPEPRRNVGKEYSFILNDLVDRILAVPMLDVHIQHQSSSPVLETMLLVLREVDPSKCTHACQVILKAAKMAESPAKSLPELMTNAIGSHLMEQVLAVSQAQEFGEILKSHFCGRLLALALHPVGNFVLQHLVRNLHTKEQAEDVYEELSDHLEDILAYNHIGVIQRLAEACRKHGIKQKDMMKGLLKAFHCHDPPERRVKCVPVIASLTTYEVFYKVPDADKHDKESSSSDSDDDSSDEEYTVNLPTLRKVNYHGAQLLQCLMNFRKTKLVVSSLLGLRSIELCMMSCDPCGSHVIGAFMKSESVGGKSKEKLYDRLKGHYMEMSCTKNGSRTFDDLWDNASLKQRTTIVKELSRNPNKLRGNHFGSFVYSRCRLYHFLKRRKEWTNLQTGNLKKRKLFQGITESPQEEDSPKKRKGEKKHQDKMGNKQANPEGLDEDAKGDNGAVPDDSAGNATKEDGHDQKRKKNKKRKHSDGELQSQILTTDSDLDQTLSEESTPSKKQGKKKKVTKNVKVQKNIRVQ